MQPRGSFSSKLLVQAAAWTMLQKLSSVRTLSSAMHRQLQNKLLHETLPGSSHLSSQGTCRTHPWPPQFPGCPWPRRCLLGSRLERRSPWPSCLVFDVLTNVLLMLNNAACVSNVCSIRGRKKTTTTTTSFMEECLQVCRLD